MDTQEIARITAKIDLPMWLRSEPYYKRTHVDLYRLTEIIDHEAATVALGGASSRRVIVCVTTKHQHQPTEQNSRVKIARLMTWP